MADIPVVSWDETSPADSQDRSLGDNRITEIKTQIREILAVDHEFIYTGQGTYWGYHNKVTLITGTTDPDAVTDCVILYAKDVNSKAELHFIDEDSNAMQLTSGGSWSGGMVDEIRMWYGTLATIPYGWGLCDGTFDIDTFKTRPNLIGEFIYGIGTGTTGTSGGNDSIELLSKQLPTHTHTVPSSGAHQHYARIAGSSTSSPFIIIDNAYYTDEVFTDGFIPDGADALHPHGVTNTGSTTAYDNRPAYFELAYIIKRF